VAADATAVAVVGAAVATAAAEGKFNELNSFPFPIYITCNVIKEGCVIDQGWEWSSFLLGRI
jgi:hypothetical protein